MNFFLQHMKKVNLLDLSWAFIATGYQAGEIFVFLYEYRAKERGIWRGMRLQPIRAGRPRLRGENQ